jgi:hypothetical protein
MVPASVSTSALPGSICNERVYASMAAAYWSESKYALPRAVHAAALSGVAFVFAFRSSIAATDGTFAVAFGAGVTKRAALDPENTPAFASIEPAITPTTRQATAAPTAVADFTYPMGLFSLAVFMASRR